MQNSENNLQEAKDKVETLGQAEQLLDQLTKDLEVLQDSLSSSINKNVAEPIVQTDITAPTLQNKRDEKNTLEEAEQQLYKLTEDLEKIQNVKKGQNEEGEQVLDEIIMQLNQVATDLTNERQSEKKQQSLDSQVIEVDEAKLTHNNKNKISDLLVLLKEMEDHVNDLITGPEAAARKKELPYKNLIKEREKIAAILTDPRSFAPDLHPNVFDNWLKKEYDNASNIDDFADGIVKMVVQLKSASSMNKAQPTDPAYEELGKAARSYYQELEEIAKEAKMESKNGSVLSYLIDCIKNFLGLETKVDKVKADTLQEEKLGSHYKSFVERLDNERKKDVPDKGVLSH